MISCIMPMPLSSRRPLASAGPWRPVLFASARTSIRARTGVRCGCGAVAAGHVCPESLANSTRAQLREWWLAGFLVRELEREFYSAVTSRAVGGVDDFKDRAAVFAGLTGDRVLSDAAGEVVHLLWDAGVPQLVGHREG